MPLSRPGDYVELVKNVGLSLRELLGSVDGLLNDLPEHLHHEVSTSSPSALTVVTSTGWNLVIVCLVWW